MHSLGVFVSCCLDCHLVVVVVYHHWLKLGVGRSLHHLMEMIVVVEVFGSMKDFGRVVVVVCLSVGLSGFHPRNLFCEKNHEEAGMVLMWIVRGGPS